MKLSIIIPVYNEVRTVGQIIEKIGQAGIDIPYEVIIIDSGSFDGSTELIKSLAVGSALKCLFLSKNLGKGFCIRQALKEASGDIILIQDADLEYDPRDYNDLLKPLIEKKTKFVLGSRHLKANTWRIRTQKRPSLYMEVINVGSEILNKIFCLLYRVNLTDTQTMYKVFHRELVDGVNLTSNGFDLDFELLSKLVNRGHIPIEVPVSYESRTVSEGKKLRFFKDGTAALATIIKNRFL